MKAEKEFLELYDKLTEGQKEIVSSLVLEFSKLEVNDKMISKDYGKKLKALEKDITKTRTDRLDMLYKFSKDEYPNMGFYNEGYIACCDYVLRAIEEVGV